MNVYIKIKIKSREFLSRFVLGAYAALRSNTVYLGDDELLKLDLIGPKFIKIYKI